MVLFYFCGQHINSGLLINKELIMNLLLKTILLLAALTYGAYSQSSGTSEKGIIPLLENNAHTIVKNDKDYDNGCRGTVNPEAIELKKKGFELLYERKEPHRGIKLIEKAISIDKKIPEAYNAIFVYYAAARNDIRKAKIILLQGIKACPLSASIHFDLASTYSLLKDPKRALKHYKISLAQGYSGIASTYFNMGNAYIDLGNKVSAIEHYKKTLVIKPDHFNARRNLIITYFHLGDKLSVKTEAKKMLELDPNGQGGKFARRVLREKL